MVSAVSTAVIAMIVLRYAMMPSSQMARATSSAAGRHDRRGSAPSGSSASSAGNSVTIERNAMKMAMPDDEAELPDALEVREHQHEERAHRGEGAQQQRGAAPLARSGEAAAATVGATELLLDSGRTVHSVVDADAHHDGDEHHREDAEVADDQRDDAHRPRRGSPSACAISSTGLTTLRKAPMSSTMVSDGGEDRRHLAVREGGGHLVVRDGRAARSHPPRLRGSRAGARRWSGEWPRWCCGCP